MDDLEARLDAAITEARKHLTYTDWVYDGEDEHGVDVLDDAAVDRYAALVALRARLDLIDCVFATTGESTGETLESIGRASRAEAKRLLGEDA